MCRKKDEQDLGYSGLKTETVGSSEKNVNTYPYQTTMHCITDDGTLKARLSLCPNTTQ